MQYIPESLQTVLFCRNTSANYDLSWYVGNLTFSKAESYEKNIFQQVCTTTNWHLEFNKYLNKEQPIDNLTMI